MQILNCDLELKLRIMGNGKPSVIISTDEGDGCGIFYQGEEPEAYHYEEWISQLNAIVRKLKEKKHLTTAST